MPIWMVHVGFVILVAGLPSLIRPWRRSGLRTRRAALRVTGVGVLLLVAGLNWPVGSHTVDDPVLQLDRSMPTYHFNEVHGRTIAAPDTAVVAAFADLRPPEIKLLRTLMSLRNLPMRLLGKPEPDFGGEVPMLRQMGVVELPSDDPAERVFGMAMSMATMVDIPIATPAEFAAFDRPSCVRVAFNIRATDRGDGRVEAVTETRIQATDAAAARKFARYWRVIQPGSAVIRLSMLAAVAERVEGLPTALQAPAGRHLQ